MAPPAEPEQLLKASQVAKMLQVSESWVREHGNRKRRPYLTSVKMGTVLRFKPSDVEEFVESLRQL